MIKLTKSKGSNITTDSKIEEVSISTIKLWKDNPRKNEAAVPKLAEIIKVRGQITPIVVWRKNMTIYKGNTTYKACKLLGYKTVKVLFADFPSEQAAIAYGIADNKSSEFAEWDDELLKNLMQAEEIAKTSGFSLTETAHLFNIKLDHASKEIDYDELWQGLPEYRNDLEKPFKSLLVHFKTEDDYKKFLSVTLLALTDKTRATWYPKRAQVKVAGVISFKQKAK